MRVSKRKRKRESNKHAKQTNQLIAWVNLNTFHYWQVQSEKERAKERPHTLSKKQTAQNRQIFLRSLLHSLISSALCLCVKVKRRWRVAVWQNKWPRQTCVFIFRVTITHTHRHSFPSSESTCQVVSENFPQHNLILFKHTHTHTDRYVVMSVYCTQLLAMIMIIKCASQKAGLML